MFESLHAQKPDAILTLMQMYREDPRDNKIDLGVGVYTRRHWQHAGNAGDQIRRTPTLAGSDQQEPMPASPAIRLSTTPCLRLDAG